MKVSCPKCLSKNIKIIDDHYVCNDCFVEFNIVDDTEKCFPMNVIFPRRSVSEFYRKPYILPENG